MKLSILGGGGFRTPFVYQALLCDTGWPRVTEVALYDPDPERLDAVSGILAEFGEGYESPPRVVATTDLEAALTGSDFVFSAVRVGGLEGRRGDEHVALDLNLLGQETTGPGGLAYAIRTIPVMVHAAEMIKRVAPTAYVINFTNPAGIVTEAMQAVLGDRVIGICDTPSALGRQIATTLGLEHDRIQLDYVGLNHLGWMRRILYDGHDVLPGLLADDSLLDSLEECQIFGRDWIRSLGSIPNEYLYYYYFNRDAVRAILDSGSTRGDFLARTQTKFYQTAQSHTADAKPLADVWREAVDQRNASYMAEAKGGTQEVPADSVATEIDLAHQGYAGVALGVMAAISRNEPHTMILNVRNDGTVHGLPNESVVEVPSLVDANGAHPLSLDQPDLHQIGLMSQVKAVEQQIIAAALSGSRSGAVKAFAMHPLVDSVNLARDLVDGYIKYIPEVAAVLTK